MSACVVDEIADRIDLLAHGVGHHGNLAPRAGFPNAPGHRIERGHAHKPDFERACDSLRRRHGDAHAGKRAGSPPDAHARDVPARNPTFCKKCIDTGDELGIRLTACLAFRMRDKLDRARFRVEGTYTDGDHLVGGVECQHVGGLRMGRIGAKRSRCL